MVWFRATIWMILYWIGSLESFLMLWRIPRWCVIQFMTNETTTDFPLKMVTTIRSCSGWFLPQSQLLYSRAWHIIHVYHSKHLYIIFSLWHALPQGFKQRYDHDSSHKTSNWPKISYRICTGWHAGMTNNMLLIGIASLPWCNFSPVEDEAGKPIIPDTIDTVNSVLVVLASSGLFLSFGRYRSYRLALRCPLAFSRLAAQSQQ